jgi:hypothetical protein
MSTQQTPKSAPTQPDMERTLELLERMPDPPRMPSVGLVLRVKTSPALWRLLPKRPLIARAIRNARRIWETSPEDREEAIGAIATIAGGTPQADALEELAREYVLERQVENVLFWRPWKAPSLDPRSSARVREALGTNRGVVLSISHTGPFHMTSKALVSVGCAPYVVAGPWYFEQPSHDYWGRRLARWRKGARVRLVRSTRSFPILKALVERGRWVMIYFDMPGSRETRFLGKTATLADGTARLASETGALVLPLRIRRAGETVWLDVSEPLDARELAGAEELHAALARLHERWILECPAAMNDPRDFGWGPGARPDAWVRLERGAS